MKAKVIERECVYAKILALSVIYAKEESRQRIFLEKISYTPLEMKVVINTIRDDAEFRRWIEKSIPVMKCRNKVGKKIEKAVVSGYNTIEDGVVSGYKAIEDSVVSRYKAIENKFVDAYKFLNPHLKYL
jgi:hypothetical protein